MEDWKIETCLIRGSMQKHKKLINESKDVISKILNICKNPYIACSFGKDSSVMAHMILQISPGIPLRFLSSGETRILHPNVDVVIKYFADMGADIQEINIDRVFTEEWEKATWQEQRKAGKGDIVKYLPMVNADCVFMGLRIQESNTRRMSLLTYQTKGLPMFCYQYKSKDLIRCCPLARWDTEDVGAYLIHNNIPWLKWYDKDGFEGRTTARITRNCVEMGALSWIQKNNQQGWRKLVIRFPEFKNFV